MLFNSLDFAIFLPIVFILYWLVPSYRVRQQNFILLLASYLFYGWWDWRFLTLILFSTAIDFIIGIRLNNVFKKNIRRLYLLLSITINIGFLVFFKYYNFFIDNFVNAFSLFGHPINGATLNIILPVGISFYTFQTLSYTIDIYKRKLGPTKNFVAFATFVSFFPQLVAGPIERATNMLPQCVRPRTFNRKEAVDGLRQILWGLFKKVVIADNCAEFANYIFSNSADLNGSTLALGALFFTFQIYGDFSGYSDIAIGTAKLFGFKLMQNFAFPYFSRDIAEFWRRWHISLSTWFRDYIYIPLGGSRVNTHLKIRNTIVIFLISGFWHGANWTFIAWGLIHAICFLPLFLSKNNRKNLGIVAPKSSIPSLNELISMLSTFAIIVLTWVFFRANNIEHAVGYLSKIFSTSLFELPNLAEQNKALVTLAFIIILILIEWRGRHEKYALATIGLKWDRSIRYFIYYSIAFTILFFSGNQQEFIYFQF